MNYLSSKKVLFFIFFCASTSLLCAYEGTSIKLLRFLYQNPAGRVLRSSLTSNSYFSALTGWLADRSLSKYLIPTFVNQYKDQINIDEALRPNIRSYKTFNDFFTRKLKPEARPIDKTPDAVVSPADGIMYAIQRIDETTEFLVKEKPFDVARLLGPHSSLSPEMFKHGTLVVVYLGPWNYHRFHFPFDCAAEKHESINGLYESVNSIAYAAGIQPLTENERHLIALQQNDIGQVAFLPVGALCVGKIVETYDFEKTIHSKGDELGYFAFGGSTIVMLFPQDTITLDAKLQNPAAQPIEIKMGERFALINRKI
jgi:phosphatidylserine decarboxylase